MTLLQFTKSVFDLSNSGINDDSLGLNEWILIFVFIVWVSSYAYLLLSLRLQRKGKKRHLSLALLLVSSIGLIIAGMINTDATIMSKDEDKQICIPVKLKTNEKHSKFR